jgi:4-amino-4-deoxy-L-arabinose transferase-like glycosyltransferase
VPPAWVIAALIVMMVVGGALRAYRLGYQSLWNDEIVSWISAQGGPWNIVTQRVENSNIPPLYYLVAGASLPLRHMLGVEAALRTPSVIAGVLSIPLLFVVLRRWLSERVALAAAAVMTISPFHVWYSQEARPYALLLLLSLIALYCVQRALDEPTRWQWKAATAIATASTFYCHTVGVAFMAFVVVFVVLATYRSARMRPWLVTFAVMALLCLPGVYRLVSFPPTESADSGRSLAPIQFGYALWSFAVGYSYGPSLDELHRPDRYAVLMHSAATVVPVGVVLLALTAIGVVTLIRRYPQASLPVALWLFFPMAFAAIGALVTVHPFNVRYTIISFLPALVLIVVGIGALPGRALPLAAWAGVATVCALSLKGYYADPRYARDDNRGAAAYLLAHDGPDAVVVAHRAFTVKDLRFYAPSVAHIMPYPRARRPGEQLTPQAELDGLAGEHSRVWLFLSRATDDENAPIIAYFGSHFHETNRFTSPGVQLLEFSRDSTMPTGAAASSSSGAH